MKKNFFIYLTIPCLALWVGTSTGHARDHDDDKKGKSKKHHRHNDDDRHDNRGHSSSTSIRLVSPSIRVAEGRSINRSHRSYEEIDYRNDRRFNYRDTHRDVSYRTRYPRQVVVYQDRSYGYNYYDTQIVLRREGYYDGPIDGIWGPGSRRALVRYQSAQGWRNDGVVDGRFIVNFGIGY